MASLDRRFSRDERIAWRVIEGEAILIDREEHDVVRLNRIGTRIWQGLNGRRTVHEIVDDIQQVFGVSRKQVHRDVLRFLRQLVRREMVSETAHVRTGLPATEYAVEEPRAHGEGGSR